MAARLTTMRESGVVTTEQKQVALANLRVTTSKSVLPAFYFLWTSGFYVRTTKIYTVLVRWTIEVKKKFFPCINKQFCTSVHIPCSGDFNMNRCSFNIHLGQPSVFISTWFCCHLSQQTKNTISYKKNSTIYDLCQS